MKVLDVQNLIETQAKLRQERNLSQFSRFHDSNPVPSIYYSINNLSTVEIGSRDIMSYVASDSPVRYNKILNLPLFSVNAAEASITYDDITGTYTDYSDTAQVLNQTIIPNPGDAIKFPSLSMEIIFVVTKVDIRAIKGEDHYVIEYSVVTTSRAKNIEDQVTDTFETIYLNIGTEDKCIIRQDDYNLLNQCIDSYGKILTRYLEENYDESIGYLRTPDNLSDTVLGMGTCKYLIKFLMDNRIIYFDEILDMIFAFETPLAFEPKHNRNFNRTFFLQKFINKTMLSNVNVYIAFDALPISLFKEIEDIKLYQSTEFNYQANTDGLPDKSIELFDSTYTDHLVDADYSGLTGLELIIAKAYNNVEITVSEFNSIIEDYNATDLQRFYLIPYVLFALKVKIKALQK